MATNHDRLKALAGDFPAVAVAITVAPAGNTHVGLLYCDENDLPRLLHLRFDCFLEDSPFPPDYLYGDPNLDDIDKEMVAGHCRLIAAKNPPIRFAIHYNPRARLIQREDTILLEKEGKGLNCVTFALAVFEHAGPGLINTDGWPKRPEDVPWHKRLVLQLLAQGVPRWYVKKVAKDIGCVRVRPEEATGACLEDNLPATFVQCQPNGIFVRGVISKHTRRRIRY